MKTFISIALTLIISSCISIKPIQPGLYKECRCNPILRAISFTRTNISLKIDSTKNFRWEACSYYSGTWEAKDNILALSCNKTGWMYDSLNKVDSWANKLKCSKDPQTYHYNNGFLRNTKCPHS